MMKLFAVYIGGATKTSNIELHDIRFVVAETIEDTYEPLRSQWWGEAKSLHIDCWAILTNADGYNITLQDTPQQNQQNKLYFVNLGGYDPEEFAEVHKNIFVIDETESKAKVKAIKTVRHWKAFHRDYMFEVEKAFLLNDIVAEKSLYIHLEKIDSTEQPVFTCRYIPIAKKKPVI